MGVILPRAGAEREGGAKLSRGGKGGASLWGQAVVAWFFSQEAPMTASNEWEALMRWFENARSGDEAALREALEEGMWTEAREPASGETALMISSNEGRLGCVLALLEEGADVDALDEWGNSALMMASAQGRRDCVQALLGAGADGGLKNKTGVGALWLAARSGTPECVELLLPWARLEPADKPERSAAGLARSKNQLGLAARIEAAALAAREREALEKAFGK